MELRVLRYFLEAANEGSLTRAALRLHIAQPSLSRQLAQLESELGKKLYYRENYGIKLTDDGLLLRKRAQEIIDLEEKARRELASEYESITGTIYFGAGETAGIRWIAGILRRLREKYPDITYRMISADAEDVSYKLDRGLIDFGLFVGKVNLNKYDCITLPDSDRWGVLVRNDDELAVREYISPSDLRARELLCSHQAKTHGEFTDWLGYSVDELHIIGTHNLAYNASVMVREGLGILLTIDGIVNGEGLKFIPLKPEVFAGLTLAWKKGAVLSKAAVKFLTESRTQNQA